MLNIILPLIPLTSQKTNASKLYHRSSRTEAFFKRNVLQKFAKFIGKHLCRNIFFKKVAGLKPATFLKKRLRHRFFSSEFSEILRTFFYRTLQFAASVVIFSGEIF